jgi:hypothetical protein
MNYHNFEENSLSRKKDRLFLFLLVAINLIIKTIPTGLLELSNDEVYYWTYALFPDWSHFDHPPMVGLLIQLFSLNLTFQSELSMRAGALILSSANIVILFYLVKRLSSRLAAYFAIAMYISSFYFNIICGLFILPDAPLMFFTLLALNYLLPAITIRNPARKDHFNVVIFGLFAGLAFLSKYNSLFLWFGVGLYILFCNRMWLKKPALYISILVTLILSIPIIYWNFENDFISFTFHGNRVGLFHNPINFNYFTQFNLGQFFYQNPVLSVIYVITLYKIFRKKRHEITEINLLLLFLGIPLILVSIFLSLFRNTLPHWTGPAFICLLILSSEYLADIYNKRKKSIFRALSAAIVLYLFILVLGTLQINTGIIKLKTDSEPVYPGQNDITLDMYGWKQAKEKFTEFLTKEGISEKEHQQLAIVTNKWYPAAHLDYYIAHPLNIKLVALGSIEIIHKYYWINKTRKINETDRVFYITDSRNYHGPEDFASCFTKIIPKDTLIIDRNHKAVKYIYIYDMVDFRCNTILNSTNPGF